MIQMEPHLRAVSRMFLTTTKWLAQHFLSHKAAPGMKRFAPFILQRPTQVPQRCYFQSCASRSGLFPTAYANRTYFQKRGLRSGPWGFISPSRRLLRKNKDQIQEVMDTHGDRIGKLAHLMGCQESSVAWMVSKDTRIVTSFSPIKVEATIRLLLDYGFSADSITQFQHVFCWNTSTLQMRIEGLVPYRKYEFSLAHVIVPERMHHMIVAMLAKEFKVMGSHPTRVSFLAELLKCKEEVVHSAMAEGNRPLLYYKLSRLKSLVETLFEHGINTKDIMANIHLLHLDPSLSKSRLKQMKQAGFFGKDKMLYMLVQNKNHYPITFNVHLSNAKAIGEHEDKYAFLQNRLQCTPQQIDILLIRAPSMKNTSPRRLKESLNILLDELELPPRTILRNHHLLFFSAKRLRSRWEVLRDLPLHEGQLVADLIMPEVKFQNKYHKWFEMNKTDIN